MSIDNFIEQERDVTMLDSLEASQLCKEGEAATTAPYTKAKPFDRLTVVETVYYQAYEESPVSIESKYERILQTVQEQVYIRRLTATQEWELLEYGWVEDPGLVHIQNLEGKGPSDLPEQERAALSDTLLLLVSHNKTLISSWVILAGESMRGLPQGELFVRSLNKPVRFTLRAIPK